MFTRLASLIGFVVAVALSLPAVAEPPSVRRAVLIGVNDYKTTEFGGLRGAVNDVVALRELLTGRFDFDEKNVEVLTDGAATREAILKA